MPLALTVIEGPHTGQAFTFRGHDTFIVGRSPRATFQLQAPTSRDGPVKDRYVSRLHFLVEITPPRCRLFDLGSRNGTFVNGRKVPSAELTHGDVIKAGHTLLEVTILAEEVPAPAPAAAAAAPTSPYQDL